MHHWRRKTIGQFFNTFISSLSLLSLPFLLLPSFTSFPLFPFLNILFSLSPLPFLFFFLSLFLHIFLSLSHHFSFSPSLPLSLFHYTRIFLPPSFFSSNSSSPSPFPSPSHSQFKFKNRFYLEWLGKTESRKDILKFCFKSLTSKKWVLKISNNNKCELT